MMILSLSLTSEYINELFHKTCSPKKLLNHKEVYCLFMPNFHGIVNNFQWVCLKNMLEGSVRRTKIKVTFTIKKPFSDTMFDTIHKNYFRIILAINCEKKIFRMKTFVLRKDFKNQIVFPIHHFIKSWPLEPGYFSKRSNLMQEKNFHMKLQFS